MGEREMSGKRARSGGDERQPGKKGQVPCADASKAKFFMKNGLRHLEPYEYVFETFVKRRWVGRELLEVFVKEFKLYDEVYYQAAIDSGKITVSGEQVASSHVLKDGQKISHTTQRAEPPVLGAPVRVVQQEGDLVVVDKPSSIPAHPCGQYHFNSVPYILAKESQMDGLHTVHRLDRLTSGLLLLAKTKTAAQSFQAQMASGRVSK